MVMQSNGLISQQQFKEMITDALTSSAEEKPWFSVQINGQSATNGAMIPIGPDNIVSISQYYWSGGGAAS